MRLTRFQWIVGMTLVASILVWRFFHGGLGFVVLGLLLSGAAVMITLGVQSLKWQMFGPSLCHLATVRKAVALTFDDGPDPTNTPRLLEVLASRGVRATFFCIGQQVAAYPQLVQRMAAAGHGIENHSYAHHYWTNLLPAKRLQADLTRAQNEISRLTGRQPAFFRPPMGLSNPRVFRVAATLNLRVTGWTVGGQDQSAAAPQQIIARIRRGLRPGAIILLHDSGVSCEKLITVVTLLIDELQSQGYLFVELDTFTTPVEENDKTMVG